MPRRRHSDDVERTVSTYVRRGRECTYGNLRLIARVAGTVYEDALRPVDLRAGQLSLLWAIIATEPVELGTLGSVTLTDPTTLSRTVEKLRKARLVDVRTGSDARRKEVRLTPLGRERFAAAMPHWEAAQRRIAGLLPVAQIRSLARQVRRAAGRAS
jgi:DNA-binding MarR family transcriptional regulator